jgi:ABC-type oligopeptide transport system substrate-binding subunit
MTAYEKIKKYLLLLSTFFVGIITIHSVFIYLYHDSTTSPEEGGSISVGLVGEAAIPSPADYSKKSEMDFILQFLYRGMIRYNAISKKLEGDLASCDLSKNYATIQCTLRSDSLWSDGTHITRDDIFATYNLFKNTDVNPGLKQLLSNVEILEK